MSGSAAPAGSVLETVAPERAAADVGVAVVVVRTEGFDRWFGAAGTLVGGVEVGAPFFFEVQEQQRRILPHGRILRPQVDRLLEFTWLTCATQGEVTVVTAELIQDEQGTWLRLNHAGFRASRRASSTGPRGKTPSPSWTGGPADPVPPG